MWMGADGCCETKEKGATRKRHTRDQKRARMSSDIAYMAGGNSPITCMTAGGTEGHG